MRFLKGMLAKHEEEEHIARDDGLPVAPDEDLRDAIDLWDDDDDDDEADEAGARSETTIPDDPVIQEEPPEVPGAPASPPPQSGRRSAPRTGELGGVRIWEMFGDESPEDAPDDAGGAPDEAPARARVHDEDEPPAPSQNELAREAMQAIQARAFDTPDATRGAPGTVGRTKTRVLGFAAQEAVETDVFAEQPRKAPVQGACQFPVGWIAVIEGPGRGAAFPLQNGVSQIGRGEGQSIQLNFGDTAISRENHASIAYDEEQNMFYIGHGGKANIVRRNGRPVLSTEELANGDMIRIGETTLRFVALCGPDFAWDLTE